MSHEGMPQQPQPRANVDPNGVITSFEGMDPQAAQPQAEAPQQEVIQDLPWASRAAEQPTEQSAPTQPVIESFPGLPQPVERPRETGSSVVVASDRAYTVGRTEAPTDKPLIDTSWLNKIK